MFARRHNATVEPGDRYCEVDRPDMIWTVVALVRRPGVPPHVRLRCDARAHEVTIAFSVLADSHRFRRHEPAEQGA